MPPRSLDPAVMVSGRTRRAPERPRDVPATGGDARGRASEPRARGRLRCDRRAAPLPHVPRLCADRGGAARAGAALDVSRVGAADDRDALRASRRRRRAAARWGSARLQQRCSRSAAEMQPRCSRGEMQPRCS